MDKIDLIINSNLLIVFIFIFVRRGKLLWLRSTDIQVMLHTVSSEHLLFLWKLKLVLGNFTFHTAMKVALFFYYYQ
jgi:hypothetical protein